MNKFRYIDRESLCKYDLSEDFLKTLSIDIKEIIPLRKVFVLITNEGKKILKMTDSKEKRIKFVDEALKYIQKNYEDVLNYHKGKDGRIAYNFQESTYVVLDMIDGREATFTNPLEIEICSKAIANMHKASNGICENLNVDLVKENLGDNLIASYKKVEEDLLNIKSFVKRFRNKNKFDNLFIENVDKYIEQVKKAQELLAITNYTSLLKDINKIVLCHNDLANHNFIIDGDKVKIIDFDYCKIDTRAIDIANFSLKAIKNNCYEMKKFKSIIDSYNSVSKLDKEEIKLIYTIFNFPRDFYNISIDYYYKEKLWDYEVFESRLEDKLNKDVYRMEFLKEFIKEMKEYFY
ncbi:CotS family spore coat protein [Caproiciproducens sp. MSJ-32]|uniref:CotS family spore coat protein n=1 Tax=Caproiciproducens sp. MSJ-32 TaxID=2841527 RepID=UPI001C0FEAAB|nr:CotS family spore coat protein [Caproiciproducens sp. MSJ-32]MBU5455227.1 CotS family spore coat protein [Caproiciproducens sp. MSJ-32]